MQVAEAGKTPDKAIGLTFDAGRITGSKEGRLEMPKEYTAPDELYRELKERVLRYHPSDDLTMIEKACHVAEEAHKGQMRKSGEPYIIHPLCVGIILADRKAQEEKRAVGRTPKRYGSEGGAPADPYQAIANKYKRK